MCNVLALSKYLKDRKNSLLEGDFKPRKVPTFKAVIPEIKEVPTD